MGLLLLYTDEEEEEEGTVMALLVLEEVLDRDRFDILRGTGTVRRKIVTTHSKVVPKRI
jgi:hypothetical protein